MTIKEALEFLFKSEAFKELAKNESNLRVYKKRANESSLGIGSAVELLKKFGFSVSIKKPKNFK